MALAVGTTAPDFTLFDNKKHPHSLSSHKGRTVILAFFPAAFTGVCTAEMCSFQNAIQRLNSANADVIGISMDSPFANNAFVEVNGLEYPVLSDYTLDTTTAYDVLFHDFAGMPGYTAAARATFVIDAEGVIRHVHVTANPGVEPNYDEIFAAVEAL